MRLKDFKVEDKVHCIGSTELYSTIDFIGHCITVLTDNSGNQYSLGSDNTAFEYYKPELTLKEVKRLGFDLYSAIRDAQWTDANDQPNLTRPTPHMIIAMNNWNEGGL